MKLLMLLNDLKQHNSLALMFWLWYDEKVIDKMNVILKEAEFNLQFVTIIIADARVDVVI